VWFNVTIELALHILAILGKQLLYNQFNWIYQVPNRKAKTFPRKSSSGGYV
jgi:hypothetical protein